MGCQDCWNYIKAESSVTSIFQVEIVRWMLNHDYNKRPTAQELLQSELLPPAQMEEAELTEVLRSTIADPNSRSYRHMVNTILSQPLKPADDFTFDMDLHKVTQFMFSPTLQVFVCSSELSCPVSFLST